MGSWAGSVDFCAPAGKAKKTIAVTMPAASAAILIVDATVAILRRSIRLGCPGPRRSPFLPTSSPWCDSSRARLALPRYCTTLVSLDVSVADAYPGFDPVTATEIRCPLSAATSVYAEPTAPSIASPDRYHWYDSVTGSGCQFPGCTVRVAPTLGGPEMAGLRPVCVKYRSRWSIAAVRGRRGA